MEAPCELERRVGLVRACRLAVHGLDKELGRATPLEADVAHPGVGIHPSAHDGAPLAAERVEQLPPLVLAAGHGQACDAHSLALQSVHNAALAALATSASENILGQAIGAVQEPNLVRVRRQPMASATLDAGWARATRPQDANVMLAAPLAVGDDRIDVGPAANDGWREIHARRKVEQVVLRHGHLLESFVSPRPPQRKLAYSIVLMRVFSCPAFHVQKPNCGMMGAICTKGAIQCRGRSPFPKMYSLFFFQRASF